VLTVGHILIAAAARDPQSTAIIDGHRSLTYQGVLTTCRRICKGLEKLGLQRGDRVLVIMQNRLEMTLIHWASQISGIVIVPINWRSSSEELSYYIKDSEAKAIAYEEFTEEVVVACTNAGNLLQINIDRYEDGRTISFDAVCEAEPAENVSRASLESESVLLYTSGTTGVGKGVPRSHRAERAATLAHVAQNALLVGERTLGVMPLYHTMGIRLLLAMALVNGVFVCQRRFEARVAMELIERHRISSLYLVPTLYHDLIFSDCFQSLDVSSVRSLGFAGASMTDGLLKRVENAFLPELLVNHYGSSEIYTFTIEQNAAKKPGSAGKAGLNSEIRIIPVDTTNTDDRLQDGQEGQIIARLDSDEAFAGYWRRPEADSKAINDGWYFTGDVGYFDPMGDLFVTGRVDDMMISGGENVLPAEVESILSLHSAVMEVAVVGLPDERLGHIITAFICRLGNLGSDELDAWCCRSHLQNFKRPRKYIFVSSIPRSPVGKILRKKILDNYNAGEYR